MNITTTKTGATVLNLTIEGRLNETHMYEAMAAARAAGCTHFAIEQAHPTGGRYTAMKGSAHGPCRERGGNPVDRHDAR